MRPVAKTNYFACKSSADIGAVSQPEGDIRRALNLA